MAQFGWEEPAAFASQSLEREWKRACRRAQHWREEDDDIAPVPLEQPKPGFTIVNLWHDIQEENDGDNKDSSDAPSDPWLQAALQIKANVEHMLHWIHEKEGTYTSVETSESEVSLVQSTITSFTATTAQEMERLRSMVGSDPAANKQLQNSIVACLLDQLKTVTVKFNKMQKLRKRMAVQIWQHPLQCRIVATPDIDQRFLPSRPSHRMQLNVYNEYKDYNNHFKRLVGLKRPASMLLSSPDADNGGDNADQTFGSMIIESVSGNDDKKLAKLQNTNNKPAVVKPINTVTWDDEKENNDLQVSLQREAVLLTAKASSDLDAIQKMEHMMVDITTLLSQFTDLVTAQQEDVAQIFDNTETSKDNMDKGKESLINAAERARGSHHYMAKAIFAMSFMLLFFHWLRP